MEIPYQFRDAEPEEQRWAERRAELTKACARDPRLTKARLLWFLSNLRKRATATEECAQQLLRSLMSVSSDESLLKNLSLIKDFPEQFEGQQVMRSCDALEEAVQRMENMKVEIRRRTSSKYDAMDEEEIRALANPKEEQKDQDQFNPPINKMYRKQNQSEIILSLASEVNQLSKEFDSMSKQHQMVQEAFAAVKGQKAWNLLCHCVNEVDHMKFVLNEMTEGQFEQGIMEYVDPKRVDNLERRLLRTDNNLKIMEVALDRLENFKAITEAMLAKCHPILEQLYITEQKEDTSAQDLKNANEIALRIGEMEVNVESMANVITLLMSRLEGRIAIIEATVKKMKLLDEAKADKDYVQSTFPLMADKALMQKTVTYKDMAQVFNEIGQKLMDCFGKIMKTMMAWQDKLEEYQIDTAYKVNKGEFAQLLEILEQKLEALFVKVMDLEIGHIQEQNLRSRDEKNGSKDLRCVTCDLDAVMNCNPDMLLPILPGLSPRYHIAPQVAYEMHLFRTKTEQLLTSAMGLSKIECPTDTSCKMKDKDTHCRRFGNESCVGKEVCTPPNTTESLVKVTELDSFGPQVVQLNAQGPSGKQIPSQADNSASKSFQKVRCKSSKMTTRNRENNF